MPVRNPGESRRLDETVGAMSYFSAREFPATVDVRHVQESAGENCVQTPTGCEELSQRVVGHIGGSPSDSEVGRGTTVWRGEASAAVTALIEIPH